MDDSQGPLECYATRQPTVHNGNVNAVADVAQRAKVGYQFSVIDK